MMKSYSLLSWGYGLVLVFILFACGVDTPTVNCDGSLTVAVTATTDTDCGNNGGAIRVSASGGSGNYEFKLDQGALQPSENFENLTPGIYTITVIDGNGCSAEETARVLSGLKLADIQPILENNCALSNCHNGSNSLPDFTSAATILNRADRIRVRTSAQTMPPAGANPISAEQIMQIACWVNDGAPQ